MTKLAIVGSGPAGFYAALRVLKKIPHAQIDMFERQAVPFGLTRTGIAPDHPEVRNCQDRFNDVATSPTFRWYGNVEVGSQLSLFHLVDNWDAVLLAYGAETDRRLGVPGEDLPGVISAREVVGWYNGSPECLQSPIADLLTSSNKATIVGNGNVALDIARILLGGTERLRKTDISPAALDTLSRSRIRFVDIVARRGPLQSAFSTKELRELQNLDGISMLPPKPPLPTLEESEKMSRQEKRKLQLLTNIKSGTGGESTWQLDYYRAPRQFVGSHRVSSVEWSLNEVDRANPGRVITTNETCTTSTDLVVKSIGYRSEPLPGMPELGVDFDARRGIVVNNRGLASMQKPIYVSGWLKTGPVGVIATTMMDAFSVGDEICSALEKVSETKLGRSSLRWDHPVVSWADWERIDAEECRRGASAGKERVKFKSTTEILEFLGQGSS